jgi:hypothetical protein
MIPRRKKPNPAAVILITVGTICAALVGAATLAWHLLVKNRTHIEIETLLAKIMKVGQDAEMKISQIVSKVRDNYYKDTGESFAHDIDMAIDESRDSMEKTGQQIKEQLQREQSVLGKMLYRS